MPITIFCEVLCDKENIGSFEIHSAEKGKRALTFLRKSKDLSVKVMFALSLQEIANPGILIWCHPESPHEIFKYK